MNACPLCYEDLLIYMAENGKRSMNFMDILIVVVLLYCLITGITKGLIREVSGILGLLVGFFAAYAGFRPLAKALSPYIRGEELTLAGAWILIFFGCILLARILGLGIRRLIKTPISVWMDRIAGSFFGLLKGGLVVVLVIGVITSAAGKDSTLIRESKLAPHVYRALEAIASAVPYKLKKSFTKENERLKKAWDRQMNRIHS